MFLPEWEPCTVPSFAPVVEAILAGEAERGMATISLVASHPMALAQCRKWLEGGGVEVEETPHTALAAQALAESGDRGKAVIASNFAAQAYRLSIVKRDIHDSADDATTFGILARYDGAGK